VIAVSGSDAFEVFTHPLYGVVYPVGGKSGGDVDV
jgi:hypothetical protein